MGYLNQFPSTNFYEQDLGWLIKQYKELNDNYENLENKYDILIKIYDIIQQSIETVTLEQLQKWLEDGTIESIILNAIDIVKKYNTLLDLKNSTTLKNNTVCLYLGRDVIGDCNPVYVHVTNVKPKIYHIELKNNLYGVILNNDIVINQLDYFIENDITELLNNSTFKKITLDNDFYFINKQINLKSNTTIDFNNAKIELMGDIPFTCFNMLDVENITLKNMILNGIWLKGYENKCFGINISASRNIVIENIEIKNIISDGIYIGYDYHYAGKNTFSTANIKVSNCYVHHVGRNGITICSGNNVILEKNKIAIIDDNSPFSCIDIEPETGVNHPLHIAELVITDNYFIQNNKTYRKGIIVSCPSTSLIFQSGNITIKDNIFETSNIRYVHPKANTNGNYALPLLIYNNYFKKPYLNCIEIFNNPVSNPIFIDRLTAEKEISGNTSTSVEGMICCYSSTKNYELGNINITNISLIGNGTLWNLLFNFNKEVGTSLTSYKKYKNIDITYIVGGVTKNKIGSLNSYIDIPTANLNIDMILETAGGSGTTNNFVFTPNYAYGVVPSSTTIKIDSLNFKYRKILIGDLNGANIKITKEPEYKFASAGTATTCTLSGASSIPHVVFIFIRDDGVIYISSDSQLTITYS